MSYSLLDEAPKDHNSEGFLDFLRANNNVVEDSDHWLVIENCKYHSPSSPWYTAFWKHTPDMMISIQFDMSLVNMLNRYNSWEWLKKAASKQTVKRFHIHLIKR